MTQLTPNTKVALTLGGSLAAAGSLLWTGWTAAQLAGEVRTELKAIRAELRAGWTSRDMRDYSVDLERLNTTVARTDGRTGLHVPDARGIQARNREN
jgi:hypothetical protein